MKHNAAKCVGILIILAMLLSAAAATAYDDRQPLRIVMPKVLGRDQTAFLEYASELLANVGFNIEFEVFSKITLSPTGHISDYSRYEQHIREELPSSDAVYLLPHGMDVPFRRDGMLTDVYDLGLEYAPMYTLQYAELINEPGEMKVLPVGIRLHNLDRLAVLVKNDVHEEYDREIRSASDLKALLMYLKEKGFSAFAPCAAYPYQPWVDLAVYRESRYTPLSLFMPEYGYEQVDHIYQRYFMYSNLYYSADDRRVYPIYELPEINKVYSEFAQWYELGLIDAMWQPLQFSLYDTLLINTGAILGNSPRKFMPTGPNLGPPIDLRDYHMYVLYPEAVRDTSPGEFSVDTRAVAGNNANIPEFLRFMEWLEDEEHYDYFRYGVEGVDYTLDADAEPPNPPFVYSHWEQRDMFQRLHIEEIMPINTPVNFDEEMRRIYFSSDLPVNANVMKEIYYEWMGEDWLRGILFESDGAITQLIYNLSYRADSFSDPPDIVIERTMESWRQAGLLDSLADRINAAIE